MNRYHCKCGVWFSVKRELTEHIGICNPHWPRTSETDEHAQVTKEQWSDKRINSYKRLREG